MSNQPRHALPSYGRIDQPQRPAQMTIAAPTPNQPAPQEDTPVVQGMKLLVAELPAALRSEMAAINARDLDERQRADAIADLTNRARPVISTAVQAVTDRQAKADADYLATIEAKAKAVDNATYEQIRHRLHDKWEHAESPVSSVQDSIEHARPEELGVTLLEAKPWLENRGHTAEFIPAVLARSDSDVGKAAAVKTRAGQAVIIAKQTAATNLARIQTGDVPTHFIDLDAVREKYDPDAL